MASKISDKLESNLKKMKPGDHLVILYKEEEEILQPLLSYISTSLKRNEKCLYITGEENTVDIISNFQKEIMNLDEFIASGQIQFLDKKDIYARNDEFD